MPPTGPSHTISNYISIYVLIHIIGGGELISFLQHNHPYLTIDAVDIDAGVVGLARRWFDYRDDNDDGDSVNDNDDNNDDHKHESESNASLPLYTLPDPDTKHNHHSPRANRPRAGHSRANRPHTKLTDAWAFLHTLATNISSSDNSGSAIASSDTAQSATSSSSSSSSSTTTISSTTSHLYYDYVLVDLFTAECTRPDNNDTNVHGNVPYCLL